MLNAGLRVKTSKSQKALADLKTIKKALQTAPQPASKRAEQAALVPQPDLRFSLDARTMLKTSLEASDKALFLDAIRGTTPLKRSNTRHTATPPPRHITTEQHLQRQRHATGQDHLLEIYGLSDDYSLVMDSQPLRDYLNPHCGTDVLRNLKKGRWPISNHIDLHGSTLDQARIRLNYFLKHSLVEQYKCVRIVHGKGYGSKDQGPVLPRAVRRWLSQLDFVLAFCDCSPQEGGNGAVKVVLRTTGAFE